MPVPSIYTSNQNQNIYDVARNNYRSQIQPNQGGNTGSAMIDKGEQEDRVEISAEARLRSQADSGRAAGQGESSGGSGGVRTGTYSRDSVANMKDNATIQQLKTNESKVIAHEQAHMSVGGRYAGGVSYSYTQGPDGRRYISGGEVPINAPEGRTPQETAQIMSQVKRAALAPAEPSPQDMKVAAQAGAKEQAAIREASIDQAQQSINSTREQRRADLREKRFQEQQNTGQSVEDPTLEQRQRRLRFQQSLAETRVSREERNLDRAVQNEQNARQDYERTLYEYQRISQMSGSQRSGSNPAAKAVNLVA